MQEGLNWAFPSLSNEYWVLHGASDDTDGFAAGVNVTFVSPWPRLGFTARLTELGARTATGDRGSSGGCCRVYWAEVLEPAGMNAFEVVGAG